MVLTTPETNEAQQLQEDARRFWDANDRLGYTLSGAPAAPAGGPALA